MVPRHVAWAAGIVIASGVVLVTLAGLLVAMTDMDPAARAAGGAGVALVGAGLIGIGWQLRRRQRWAHRAAIAFAVLQLMISLVNMVRDGRAALPWLPGILLWLLLRAPTRRWLDGVPEPHPDRPLDEPNLDEINRRFAERPVTRD